MNAYELADELQELDAKLHLIDLFKSAVMLRQQADRIAELENNTCSACGQKVTKDLIHTCSPQTKPLSDEEIDSIIYSVDWAYDPVLLARAIEERHGIK